MNAVRPGPLLTVPESEPVPAQINRHAWIDESGSHRDLDPNTYIFGAALCRPSDLDSIRAHLQPLLLPHQQKVHWRTEKAQRRHQITQRILTCPGLEHLVVVRSGTPSDTKKRPRTATLKSLLYVLEERGVTQAIFESRGKADDQRDRQTHSYLTQQHYISRVRMSHQPGKLDPGLWIPDALCGIVSADRTGNPAYLNLIRERISIIAIDWTTP